MRSRRPVRRIWHGSRDTRRRGRAFHRTKAHMAWHRAIHPRPPDRRSSKRTAIAGAVLAVRLPAARPRPGASHTTAQAALPSIKVIGNYDNAVGTSDAASQGTVTSNLIQSRPTLRPAEVLEFVPGVIVTQHSGDGKANQYFLRGFNLDHGTDFATFVDGMPVNMVSHAHGQGYSDLNWLMPELVNASTIARARTTPTKATSRRPARPTSTCSAACRAASPPSRSVQARLPPARCWPTPSSDEGRATSLYALEDEPQRRPLGQLPENFRKPQRPACATAWATRPTAPPSPPWLTTRALELDRPDPGACGADDGLIDRFGAIDDDRRRPHLSATSLSMQTPSAHWSDGVFKANAYAIQSTARTLSQRLHVLPQRPHVGQRRPVRAGREAPGLRRRREPQLRHGDWGGRDMVEHARGRQIRLRPARAPSACTDTVARRTHLDHVQESAACAKPASASTARARRAVDCRGCAAWPACAGTDSISTSNSSIAAQQRQSQTTRRSTSPKLSLHLRALGARRSSSLNYGWGYPQQRRARRERPPCRPRPC